MIKLLKKCHSDPANAGEESRNEILRGVYPEVNETLPFVQGDNRRAQDDRSGLSIIS
jgi:hypothetical protein